MGRPSKLPVALALLGTLAAVLVINHFLPGSPDEKMTVEFLKTPERTPETNVQIEKSSGMELPFDLVNGEARFGDPEAKVQVIAFIPSAGSGGCGNETGLVLHSLQKANAEQMYVHVLDFDSEAGQTLQAQLGSSCAGLFVNGEQEVELAREDGTSDEVNFKSNLGDTYTRDQLVGVLNGEFTEAYGSPMKEPIGGLAPDPHDHSANDASGDSPEGETNEEVAPPV